MRPSAFNTPNTCECCAEKHSQPSRLRTGQATTTPEYILVADVELASVTLSPPTTQCPGQKDYLRPGREWLQNQDFEKKTQSCVCWFAGLLLKVANLVLL